MHADVAGALGWFAAGFGFWLLLIVSSVVLLAAIEFERGVLAFGTLAIAGTILGVAYGVNPFAWVLHHPALVLQYAVGYFVVGVAWAVIKWYLFVRGQADRYRDFLVERLGSVPEKLTAQQHKTLGAYTTYHLGKRPTAQQNKGRIMLWMTYWPWSMLWTLINDPVRRIVRHLYYRITGMLERISKRVWRDLPDVE